MALQEQLALSALTAGCSPGEGALAASAAILLAHDEMPRLVGVLQLYYIAEALCKMHKHHIGVYTYSTYKHVYALSSTILPVIYLRNDAMLKPSVTYDSLSAHFVALSGAVVLVAREYRHLITTR